MPYIGTKSEAQESTLTQLGFSLNRREPTGLNRDEVLSTSITSDMPLSVTQQQFGDQSIDISKIVGDVVTAQNVQNSTYTYFADTAASDAYAITPVPAITGYAEGQTFTFKATTANTGAATLNVNGFGAKTIKKNGTSDLATGDIVAGQIITVYYDGTNFQTVATTIPTGAQVDIFTSNDTWTKPSGADSVYVICVGGGGGGGGGGGIASGTAKGGGSGGGGGAKAERMFRASDLSATVSVTVGAGGTAGTGGTTGAGTDGGVGGTTTFGTHLSAFGGGGGDGGLTSLATSSGGGGGGTAGSGQVGQPAASSTGGLPASTSTFAAISGQGAGGQNGSTGECAEWGGASGAGRSSGSSINGGSSIFGAGGGGMGGNVSSVDALVAAGTGGGVNSYVAGGGGAVNTAGANGDTTKCGTGGGGGSPNASGTGTAGGAGGAVGGGGGGGGAGTPTGGAGGVGGIGTVWVFSW